MADRCVIPDCNCPDSKIGKLQAKVRQLEADVEAAAGELMVDMADAPPGSLVARLLIANRLLSRKHEAAWHENVDLKAAVEALLDDATLAHESTGDSIFLAKINAVEKLL